MRQVAHLDLDSFYVNCTLLQMPKLIGRPIIIGGTSNRGMVASASPEAQKYGVHANMPTRVAMQRCPDATLLKGDFELFSKYSDVVNEILTERAPVHERAAIDEFYMDMTGMDRFHGSLQFTKELAGTVKKETGLPLVFGLSVNKTVAKICTAYAKPEGSFEVSQHQVQPFLDPQSIRRIPAIGPVSFKLLRRIRIKFIRNIRTLPMEAMDELLGQNGVTIWKKANGIDNTPVVPYSSKKSISKDYTFDSDTQNMVELKAILSGLVEHLGFQLRKLNFMCSLVTVRIRYSNHDTETAQRKVSYTASDDTLMTVAYELFKKLYQRRMLIRLIGVNFSQLVHGSPQIHLFNDDVKMIQLLQAMDKMKNRYDNPSIIQKAFTLGYSY